LCVIIRCFLFDTERYIVRKRGKRRWAQRRQTTKGEWEKERKRICERQGFKDGERMRQEDRERAGAIKEGVTLRGGGGGRRRKNEGEAVGSFTCDMMR